MARNSPGEGADLGNERGRREALLRRWESPLSLQTQQPSTNQGPVRLEGCAGRAFSPMNLPTLQQQNLVQRLLYKQGVTLAVKCHRKASTLPRGPFPSLSFYLFPACTIRPPPLAPLSCRHPSSSVQGLLPQCTCAAEPKRTETAARCLFHRPPGQVGTKNHQARHFHCTVSMQALHKQDPDSILMPPAKWEGQFFKGQGRRQLSSGHPVSTPGKIRTGEVASLQLTLSAATERKETTYLPTTKTLS